MVTEKGLLLERGTCLRGVLRRVGEFAIPWAMKLQWALEAADGLAYIHSKEVIHADVGCHNVIVDIANHIKLIDFAGSGIDGEAPLVCYEWCSFQPGTEIGICTDIFAFGSMLFELETGRVPYSELERSLDTGELVAVIEGLFSQQKFPPILWPSRPSFLGAGLANISQWRKSVEILHVALGITRRKFCGRAAVGAE